jgi:hypothetical protein
MPFRIIRDHPLLILSARPIYGDPWDYEHEQKERKRRLFNTCTRLGVSICQIFLLIKHRFGLAANQTKV